jgi:hypothetical protein
MLLTNTAAHTNTVPTLKVTKRKILVILSNRWNPAQKLRFVELLADEKGTVLKESPLRSEPRKPLYNEVWENDEGKSAWALCNRFRRRYSHRLQKKTT